VCVSLSLWIVFEAPSQKSVGFMIHSIRLLAWCYNYTG
jgi:hypothetical protein